MKTVLPLALIGALAVGTAYAAGGSSSSMKSQSGMNDQSSMSSSSRQSWSASDVKQIQSKLKQQGYDVGQVDGKLGPNTQQALRQFQEDKGIQATGQPDQQTMAALNVSPSGTQQGQLPGGSSRGQSGTSGSMGSPSDQSGSPQSNPSSGR